MIPKKVSPNVIQNGYLIFLSAYLHTKITDYNEVYWANLDRQHAIFSCLNLRFLDSEFSMVLLL